MAEVTRERTGEILEAVLEILKGKPDGLPAKEVIAEVGHRVTPTPFELADYPSTPGTRRFDKIVRFSTISAVKAGWIVKRRGTWTVTDAGVAVIGAYAKPGDLSRRAHQLYAQWKKAQPDADPEEVSPADDEVPTATLLEEAEESRVERDRAVPRRDAAHTSSRMSSRDLVEAMGYYIAWVAPPGPDQGIDIIASTDPLGAKGPRIKVQVKRHQSRVTVDGIRAFMAVLGANDIGLFVNTGGFTRDAEREARTQETRRITLLDAQALFELWVEHYGALDESARQRFPLRPVHFLAPRE